MTISIWRYSHLALAVSSFLFLILAAGTGIILAFDPVTQKTQPYRSDKFNQLTVAATIPVLKEKYRDITEVNVDANQFVVIHGSDQKDEPVDAYVDPATGKQLGVEKKKSEFFEWVTSLHRSLFLHETGRIFIGITAFILLLIASSGIILLIQRQRGVKRFFKKIVRDSFAQYFHVVLGRLSLIPILIIALSGTILSLARFGIIPDKKITHKVDIDAISSERATDVQLFAAFKNIPLSDVRSIEFPFSEDPEDYYTLKLKDRELVVNQINGDVLSEQKYPFAQVLSSLSLDLHTGRASAVWAIILAIASLNILFFIWSGFVITWKRRGNRVKNKYSAENSKFIILVGSENGNTYRFANAVHEQIIKNGQSSFITELNSYKTFPSAENIVVITATYGLGNPPSNAAQFADRLKRFPQGKQVGFSVVGFGSHAYPDFCKFAFEVNNMLSAQTWARPLVEVHTVNDRSPSEFALWAECWSQQSGIKLEMGELSASPVLADLENLVVTTKHTGTNGDSAFLLQLKPDTASAFRSGDLLAIYPANDHRERLYSIGKIDSQVQLSVKLHSNGLGSSFLHALEPGQVLQAKIVSNKDFHFPAGVSAVAMIANGTGIAPFLGMIEENDALVNCSLYCGFRNRSAFELYTTRLEKNVAAKKLSALHVAYSREEDAAYVHDLILRDKRYFGNLLANKGVIMLCGSLAMQKSAIEVLETISRDLNDQSISFYQSHGQILMDCY
jgi:sulfite reductase (NADPH) flavoprotein alpha-component